MFSMLGICWLAAFIQMHYYLMPVIAALMPVAAVYIVRRYYKYIPIITIDDTIISFNG